MRFVLATFDRACFDPSVFTGVHSVHATKEDAEREAAQYLDEVGAEGECADGRYVGIDDLETGEHYAVLDRWDA